jgi:heptosyltransferase-1
VQVDLTAVRRVLLVRMSAIGDVVHTLPVAAALKRSFPHLELTWAVEERCAPIVEVNPFVDHVFPIPRHRWRETRWRPSTWWEGVGLLRKLRAARFEVALDLQGLLKSAAVARLSGAPVRLGYHWQREGARFLIKPVPPRPGSRHVVQQYLDVVRSLGAVAEPIDFGIRVPEASGAEAGRMLRDLGIDGPYAVINPSAGSRAKRWPPEHFAAIADRLEKQGLPAVHVGHALDKPLADQIARAAQSPMRSLVGRTNLRQLCAVLQAARVHLCGDTGSGHIAAALGVPVVALYGLTDPQRSGPFGQLDGVVSRFGQAPKEVAVQRIPVDEVWEKLRPHVPKVGAGV